MVENNKEMPSLLPYLDSRRSNFYLNLPLVDEDLDSSKRMPLAFRSISDSDPLCRLIEAEALTDAGSRLKRVFLLVQRDKYLLSKNVLFPMTNRDVETFWQTTFSFHQNREQDGSPIILSSQIAPESHLIPFQSLFFCQPTQTFFHPPCPHCCLTLQQCDTDELLKGLDLQLYSTSLSRYLYCPSCFDAGSNTDFYAYEVEDFELPMVKDRRALILDFCKLLGSGKHEGQIPCIECPIQEECYGSDGQVLSRMVPFSFYPFHMLMFDAMSLLAPDFLSLISGASLEELERHLHKKREFGRASCLKELGKRHNLDSRFLFAEDERYFFEVLYLKLSFLVELAHDILRTTTMDKRPDLSISLGGLWIKLGNVESRLPSFWSFEVHQVGIVTKPLDEQNFPTPPASYDLHLLGLSWFYALVVNSQQDMSQVHRALEAAFDSSSRDEPALQGESFKETLSPTFAPGNIFWNPRSESIPPDDYPLWEKILSLGLSLLRASNHLDPGWSKDGFFQQAADLRKEVKNRLFSDMPQAAEQIDRSENEAIYSILAQIRRKWQTELERKESVVPEDVVQPSTDLQLKEEADVIPETVMLSPDQISLDSETPMPDARVLEPVSEAEPSPHPQSGHGKEEFHPRPRQAGEEDLIPETVMLSPEQAAGIKDAPPTTRRAPEPPAETGRPPSPVVQQEEEIVPETIILSPEQAAGIKDAPPATPRAPSPVAPQEEEIIPETIILSPEQAAKSPGVASTTPRAEDLDSERKEASFPHTAQPQDEDMIPETVILSPDDLAAEGEEEKTRKKKIEDAPVDDFTVETVFLSPRNDQDEDKGDTTDE